ncbi:uncharacterized protein LOC131039690 isoform X2 [Cryptomeria japonica]|nr:uncharacterized protein LOC131039690 isoform X2 [Cryptomeria japonica]
MEYDEGDFTDKDCQLAEKDGFQSNTQGHQQGLPRFDIGEHIDVQLGFDSLEESVLLQAQSQREEAWGSHFSREENGVLGLEAVSQNIEFSSTTTETCTILRHINVWSEATSTESVQMLLNSVGEEEGKLVEESKAQESLPSNVVAVLDAQAEKSADIDQRGLKSSAMEARYHNQKNSTSSELASDNILEPSPASRPEDEGYISNKEDTCERFQMLHTECGQQRAITASTQQLHANCEQTEFQVTSSPVLAECNVEKAGTHAIEVTMQDELPSEDQGLMSTVPDETRNDSTKNNATLEHTVEANLQGGTILLVEPNESNNIRCSIQKSQESFISSEVQETSSSSEKPLLDKTIKGPTDSLQANVPLAAPLQGIETANEQDGGKMEERIEQMKVDSTQYNTEKHVAGVSLVSPLQGIETANEQDVVDMQETIVQIDPLQGIEKANEQDVVDMPATVEQAKADSTQHDTEKHMAGVSHTNVVLEKGENHDGGKHVIEAPNKDILLASNNENSKFDGEQGNASEKSFGTSSLLQEKVIDKDTVVKDDVLATRQIMPGFFEGDSKPEEHAHDKSSHEPSFQKSEEISDPMEVESMHDQTQKYVLGFTPENTVLVEVQRNQGMLLQNDNEDGGGKHATEVSIKHEGEQGIAGSDDSMETPTGNSLKTGETVITPPKGDNHKESRLVIRSLVANSVSSQDDQNQKVLSTPAEELLDDGTGSSAGDAAEKCLLEDKKSINMHESGNQESKTPEQCHISSSDIGKNHENECKSKSVESIIMVRENEAMDEVIDFSKRKIIAPVFHSDIERDKPIAGAVSVQVPKILTLPTEQATTGKCKKPSQTPDMDSKVEDDPIEEADQKEEFEKGVKEVNMLHGFKAQVDQNTEMVLEANCCASQNDTVKECDVNSLEAGQNQENEKKNTSTESVVSTMETDSTGGKEMTLISLTDVETVKHNSEAVLVQDTKETILPAGQVMSDIIQEPVQMTDACHSPVGVKEVNTTHDSKAQEDRGKEALFSDNQQSMPAVACSGDSSHQTHKVSPSDISEREDLEKAEKDEQHVQTTGFPLKEAEEFEKDKDEAMEVSLEVGISLEPDNESPAREEDRKTSVDNIDLASSGKWSVNSKVGGNKVDRLETAGEDPEGLAVYKTDDAFKFDVGRKDATSGGEIVSPADFGTSDKVHKNAECQKTFQATQSIEVRKDNASAVCQSEEVQAEARQENANDNVRRNITITVTDSVVEEGQVKAKHLQSDNKIGEENGTKELEKTSTIHYQKAVDVQVPSTSIANSTQSTSSSAMQTSTLPDLNATVAPTSVLFQQPFTDSQQVQLRAQILVYGSLIQGALPEEALMLTAFADIGGASQNDAPLSDGGRSLWENAWHSAADRIHRKTLSHTSEAPINASGSGTPATVSSKILEGMKTPSIVNVTDSRNSHVQGLRSADLAASRSHSVQTRVTGTPNIGRAGSKNVPSGIMSPPRPVTLPSSVWGMSSPVNEGINIPRSMHVDPHQMAVARHLYQSPQLGHFPPPGNTNPWLSPLHFPGPWLTPPQGTLPEPGLPFSSFLVPEVAQETLNNRRTPASSSATHPSMTHAIPHFPTMAVASTGHVTNVNMDTSKGIVGSGKQPSSEQKSRKRKKKSVSEEIAPSGGLTPSGPKVKSMTGVSKHAPGSTPVSSQAPSMAVTTSSNALYAPSTNVPPVSNYQIIARGETGQRVIFSEETASRIEQARLNAEEAASSAASAVRHSQGIWSQLAVQKSSGLVSECEAKLASAAVAAAAAASVAKAAAAAAKVASDAAVQAKLMATEALNSDGKTDSGHSAEARLLEGSQGHSRSIISAARETAKKRVEAASAATKRAENLDAVVRAAELAAQAVTQAGAVVAMGDPVPLSLNALLEAGPETYWKLVTEQAGTKKDDNVHSETPPLEVVMSVEKNNKQSKSKNKRDALKSETARNSEGVKSSSADMLKLVEKGCRLIPTAPLDNISIEKDTVGRKENQLMGTTQSSVLISDAEGVSREATSAPEAEHITETYKKALALKANEIKEGSFVEVVSDEEGLRGVWFAAKVLSLKDGKALVLYDELLSDEGPGQLREWIPLEGENGKPPRIRMAHPMTVMKFEGTRKRRRAAMGSYVWSVGDHVDAWIRDGWWEGIITEKKDDDESKLTVHFPGEGDTSIIKVYNLRPSLVWEDGQWVEWTCLKAGKEGAHEDGLPSEKRHKVDKQDNDGQTKGKDKLQKIPNLEEAKKMQELNALMASGKDKSLTNVKNSSFDGSLAGIRVNQLGLQKEGSKVIFGVPKPTKKRKFMDVSKHYVADKMTRNSPDMKYSSKFDKQKLPISHSHIGFKAANKVDDKKLKRPVISKPKDFKFGRGHDGQSRTKSEKDNNSAVNPTVTKETLGQELGQSAVPATGIDGSKGGRRVGLGGSTPSTKSGEASNSFVSKEPVTFRPSPSNGVNAPSATDSEQGSKGKLSSASDNSSLNIEKAALRQEISKDKISEKLAIDTMEPRRSNRRIQPTSRLLEGLQTSPISLKSSHMGFSHEKGGKAQSKISSSIPKGNING